MEKLIRGIVDFRHRVLPGYRETFARLALGQKPDALFIACSDSRVVPNLFASSDPGDLFVVRNVGNLVPPCGESGISVADESELAAIEFALLTLKVRNIIVCGHSECGAIDQIFRGLDEVNAPHLKSWLRHGLPACQRLPAARERHKNIADHNLVSQQNVLLQMEHLLSYPVVQERVVKGELGIHGWWFDIAQAEVYNYEARENQFILIDDAEAERLLRRLQ